MSETPSESTSFIDPDLPMADLANRYLHAMLTREQKQGRDLIMGAVEHGQSIKDIYLNVFQPVMFEIGRLWQSGKISVGQEHYCTNATQVIMSMLYPQMFTKPSSGKRMLAACVQGELHELGLRMVADFFEMDGWNTEYLGANTPHDSIIREIEEKSADVLAIGVTMFYHLEKAQKMIEAVRRATGTGKVKILLGGYIIKVDQTLWRTLGADGFADNARDAIALAGKLTKEEPAITQYNTNSNVLKPVSPDTLKTFDALLALAEEDVLRECLSVDNPEHTMGPDAEAMIKSGLWFLSKLLRTSMTYGTEKIIEDQLAWCQKSLPGYGVSMWMILNNFERYDRALKNRLVPKAYAEILPYLTKIIQRQRAIVKATDGNDQG